MLRTSTHADLPALQQLWQRCFGDSPSYTALYFSHLWQPEQIFIDTDAQTPRAMVIWFPLLLAGAPAAYFYAVCTDEACRGQGICTRLMAFAEASLHQRGIHQFLLVPGSAGLFRFYAALGYRRCGCIGQTTVCHPTAGTVTPIDAATYLTRRARNLPIPHAVYSLPLLRHQQRLCSYTGGGLFALGETGCAAAEQTPDGQLLVKELLGCDPQSGGNQLLHHLRLSRGIVRYPSPEGSAFCMGKNLRQSPCYLGLAFD